MEKKSNKVIPINTNASKFFRQYVELLNPILKLREKELDVLSELLKMNNELKSIDEKNRWKLVFDYDSKREMADNLGMSEASFNNNLSFLRKSSVIINNRVVAGLLVYPEGNSFDFVYRFKIDEVSTG